jgi:hypothetical protein
LENGRNGNIMEGMSMFKICCMLVWSYHNEIPSSIDENLKTRIGFFQTMERLKGESQMSPLDRVKRS